MDLYDNFQFMFEGGFLDWNLVGTLMFGRLITMQRSYEEREGPSDTDVRFHEERSIDTFTDEDREFLKELKIKA